jgi:Thiamine biosynthesis ATP pyrophosphatase
MDLHKLVSTAQSDEKQITIEATVVTGFEDVVVEECQEKFGKDLLLMKSIGRVFFNIDLKDIEKVKELRGIDNILFIIATFENFGFSNKGTEEDSGQKDESDLLKDKLKDVATIQNKVLEIDWKKYMEIWKQITNYNGVLYPSIEQFNKYNDILRHKKSIRNEINIKKESSCETEPQVNNVQIEKGDLQNQELKEIDINSMCSSQNQKTNFTNPEENLLKFRVTCNRVGKHTVTSMESERAFGGKLNDTYFWLVDLDDYDIDINLQIRYNEAYVGLPVTQTSLHRRNIVEFNITTLKPTIAYNMVSMYVQY